MNESPVNPPLTGLFEGKLFREEPFTKREAFLWLVRNAATTRTVVEKKGEILTIERGQLVGSLRGLKATWGWKSPRKVHEFLVALAQRNACALHNGSLSGSLSGSPSNVITICNYEELLAEIFPADRLSDHFADHLGVAQRITSGAPENTEYRAPAHTTHDSSLLPTHSVFSEPYTPKKDPPTGGPKKVPSPQTPLSVLSEAIGQDLARDWMEHRMKLKRPMTLRAVTLFVGKLSRIREPIAAVEKAIEHGWLTVYEDDGNGGNHRGGRRGNEYSRLSAELDAIAAEYDARRGNH